MKQIISSKFESAVQLVESNGRSKANRKLVKKISRRGDLNIRQTKAIPIVPSKSIHYSHKLCCNLLGFL